MKALAIVVALGCSVLAVTAQSQNAELHARAVPDPAFIGPQPTNRLQRIFGPTATYEGVLPDVRRRGSLLTRRDLAAPGRDFRNVSVNPHNGRAEGITLFAIRF